MSDYIRVLVVDDDPSIVDMLRMGLEAEGIWDAPIVTEVVPLDTFWPAEDYHQRYFERNPNQTYCRAVVSPKVRKFREKFAHRLKKQAG